MNKTLRVFKLIIPYTLAWFVAIIFMGIFTICSTASVMGMIPLIDKVLSNKPIELKLSFSIPYESILNDFLAKLNSIESMTLLKMICLFLLIATVIKGISQFIQQYLMEWVSQHVARDLRIKLFKKYFLLPSGFFTGAKTGDMITRITLDVNLIQGVFSGRFTNSLLDTLHFFPFLIIVLLIDWRMTLICTVVLPLALLPIIMVGRQIRKITHKTQQNFADISSNVFEVLNALKIVKIFSQVDRENEQFLNTCNKTVKTKVKAQKKEAVLSPVTELIGVTTGVFLLWSFAPKVLDGKMSLGVFFTYITCIASLVKPIKTMGKIQIVLQNALAGADRIFKILDTPNQQSEISGDINDFSFEKFICFQNVSFEYNKNEPVLKDISFEIKKGEIVALVGRSGSGKTTIANLIPRFYDSVKGDILFDNINSKDISASSLRKKIGMVTQEAILFNASVFDNIAYAKPDASRKEVEEVAKIARAHRFIINMDKAYDTIIGERGIRLSGGQKQRIAIARALLNNPEIFLFDEATSALDAENEKLVQEAIDKAMIDRTVLVIAHRLSTVKKAHKIIVLDGGKIIQEGTHLELINQDGLYKKLYEINFSE